MISNAHSHPRRRVVLDATAAGALRSDAPGDARRAVVMATILSANGGAVVPTSVRIETGWDRRSPEWAGANRLVRDDDVLDRVAADLGAAERSAAAQSTAGAARTSRRAPSPSVADRHVATAALRQAERPDIQVVEVLTGDVDDIRAVLDRLATPPPSCRIDIQRV